MRENSELKWELKTVAKKDHRHDGAAESGDLFSQASPGVCDPRDETPNFRTLCHNHSHIFLAIRYFFLI